MSRTDLARQAQQALARQHQAQAPKPAVAPASPASAKRSPWLAIGIVAAAVVVLALVGALVLRGRGSAAEGGRKGTEGTKRAAGTETTEPTAGAAVTRAVPVPSRLAVPVPTPSTGGTNQITLPRDLRPARTPTACRWGASTLMMTAPTHSG